MALFTKDTHILKWRHQLSINRKLTKQNSLQSRINNQLIRSIKGLEARIVNVEKIVMRKEKVKR